MIRRMCGLFQFLKGAAPGARRPVSDPPSHFIDARSSTSCNLLKLLASISLLGDFPGGPVVQNPPANTGDSGPILDPGTKIPLAVGQLNL